MSGQLATSETILVSAAGVIAADSAGLSSVKSYANLLTSIAALPLAGGTLTGNLLFNATNTYDIGNGTYDPRTVRAATSVLTPLVNNTNAAALIVGNSTYGVTFPGNVTCPGAGTASERFGSGATAAGLRGVAVGNGAASIGDRSASGGYAATSGEYGAAWGYFANATANSVAVGGLCGYAATGVGYTSVGYFTVPGAYNYSIQLGYQAAATASNQLQIGSAAAPITQQRFHTQGGSLTFANETGTFLTAANTGLLTLGNSTYGVTVPGAATFSGDISMSKTSAQGYLYAYNTAGTRAARLYQNGNHSYFDNTGGNIYIRPTAAAVVISTPGLNTITYFANTDDTQYVSINYTSISSTGNLNLVPTGGTVAVTGAVTASGTVTVGTYTVATLPAAGSNAYSNANVSDSNAAASGNYGATVAGGGSNKVRVFSDGTNWVIA